MYLLSMISFCFIFAIIYLNIAPFVHADTFGHYLRTREKHYVYSNQDEHGNITIYNDISEHEIVKEKCNPWLNFWHLVKMKPGIIEYEFDSEETKELWNKIQ